MFKKPSITIACALWLLINLVLLPFPICPSLHVPCSADSSLLIMVLFQATQAFVAALGLNWSLDTAVDSSFPVAGTVKYANLTQFFFNQGGDSAAADQLAAHEVCCSASNVTK